jgi:hypothetical protein
MEKIKKKGTVSRVQYSDPKIVLDLNTGTRQHEGCFENEFESEPMISGLADLNIISEVCLSQGH